MCVCACVRAPGCVGLCRGLRACMRVALLIQHATRMRNIVTSFVAFMVPPYFSTLSYKRHDFQKEGIDLKTCVLIFYTTFI